MKKLNFLFILLFSFWANAQTISGKIVSEENNTAIPYAKIGILNSNFGVQSDEKGDFEINLDQVSKDQNLIVMVAGYQTFQIKVSNFINLSSHNIRLKERISNIQEVAISPKKLKEKNYGVNSKSKSIMIVPNLDKEARIFAETALEVNSSKKLKISKFNLNFAKFETNDPVKIRLTVYNEKDGKPDQMILEKEIIATITKDKIADQTFSLDVNDQKIWVQGKFFIGVQYISKYTGAVAMSGALFRTGYYRTMYGPWEKLTIAAPAVNIDTKVMK